MVQPVAGLLSVFALAAVLLRPSAAAAQPAAKKYALLIGVNKYLSAQVPPLKYARNDLVELRRLLEDDQGYDVRAVPDDEASRSRIISELVNIALRATESDTFILYYAGHGVRNVEINRKTYWLTYSTQINMLDIEGIRIEHLLDYVRDIPAGRKLIMLDHCFSGDVVELAPGRTPRVAAGQPAPPGAAPAGAAGPARDAEIGAGRLERVALPVEEFKRQVQAPQGTTVIAASRGPAYELEDLKHGVFTAALLEACRTRNADEDKNAKLSVFELVKFAQRRVPELLDAHKAPLQEVVGHSEGDVPALSWDVCSLGVGDEEARKLSTAHKTRLNAWKLRGWITQATVVRCFDVLLKWEDAGGDAAQLSEVDQAALRTIREALDPTAASSQERPRAEALKVFVESEVR